MGWRPLGEDHQPEPTKERTGQGDGTAMTPSGHFWDCMTETFQYNPNIPAERGVWHKNWLHGATRQPSSITWAKSPNGLGSMSLRLTLLRQGIRGPEPKHLQWGLLGVLWDSNFHLRQTPFLGYSPHPEVATTVSCFSFYARKWKHTEKRL